MSLPGPARLAIGRGLDSELSLAVIERGPYVGALPQGTAPCQFVRPVASTLSFLESLVQEILDLTQGRLMAFLRGSRGRQRHSRGWCWVHRFPAWTE